MSECYCCSMNILNFRVTAKAVRAQANFVSHPFNSLITVLVGLFLCLNVCGCVYC